MILFTNKLPNLAQVNMESGNIYINKDRYLQLPKSLQNYLIQHELGHFELKTDNEFKADEYAFKRLAGKSKNSLKDSITFFTKVLPFTTAEHYDRLKAAIIRAAKFDYEINGNKEALILINKLNKMKNTYVFPVIQSDKTNDFDFPIILDEDKSTVEQIIQELLDEKYKKPLFRDGIFDAVEHIKHELPDEKKPKEVIEREIKPKEPTPDELKEESKEESKDESKDELKEESKETLTFFEKIKKSIEDNNELKYIAIVIVGIIIYKIIK